MAYVYNGSVLDSNSEYEFWYLTPGARYGQRGSDNNGGIAAGGSS
jgi:hypothetical protein